VEVNKFVVNSVLQNF